eukprot:349801-Chlamydomonas_euryale.AAC.60
MLERLLRTAADGQHASVDEKRRRNFVGRDAASGTLGHSQFHVSTSVSEEEKEQYKPLLSDRATCRRKLQLQPSAKRREGRHHRKPVDRPGGCRQCAA